MTSWSTPRTWATNDDITAARLQAISDDLNMLWTQPFARKTATESVTASTTLQDDDDLQVTVVASTVYQAEVVLLYDADSAGDMKWALSLPSGATCSMAVQRLAVGAASTSDDSTIYADVTSAVNAGGLGTGSTQAVLANGLIVVSSTAGTAKVQWAQVASSGTATRMFAGSYISLVRRA